MQRIILVLGLLLVAAETASPQGWQDDFEAGALDARWTWRTPVEGPLLSLTERPGWLRVGIPQRPNGYNHWNNPQADDAPQLRTAVPPGDWQLEARLQLAQFDPTNHFHVGLMVGTRDAQILTWGLLLGPGLPGGPTSPEAWLEPTGNSGYVKVPGETLLATFRLTKTGNIFRAELRRGDGDWEQAGTYAFPEEPVFAGLIGKTFSDGHPVIFDVDYVSLWPAAEREVTAPPAPAAPQPPPPAPPAETPAAETPAPAPSAAGMTSPAWVAPSGALDSGTAPSRSAAVPESDAPAPPPAELVALAQRVCDLGDRYLRQKRYADAQTCYRLVLLSLPQSPRAQAGLRRARAPRR